MNLGLNRGLAVGAAAAARAATQAGTPARISCAWAKRARASGMGALTRRGRTIPERSGGHPAGIARSPFTEITFNHTSFLESIRHGLWASPGSARLAWNARGQPDLSFHTSAWPVMTRARIHRQHHTPTATPELWVWDAFSSAITGRSER